VACHVFSSGWTLISSHRGKFEWEAQSRKLFGFVGMSLFAAIIALGFLVYLAGERIFDGDINPALSHVALLVALAAWPLVSCGLSVHRALTDEPAAGAWRTAGTAVALAGMIFMLLAGFLAWPSTWSLLLVCLFNFAIFTYVALRYELPIVHAIGLPC